MLVATRGVQGPHGIVTRPEAWTETVKEQPEAAPREVKYEARPDPDKPGWGRIIGQEIGKAREDRASQE